MATTQTLTDYLPVKGATLYYEITGRGLPLVLVHSRWMHSSLWDRPSRRITASSAMMCAVSASPT
jgi:pimeloyl-ACP methyl ester carboxylesterase